MKKAKNTRNLEPPNASPIQRTTRNGKNDLTIDVVLTHLPLRKIRAARLTTFHPPAEKRSLFRLLATKEWQLQVKRLYERCWNSCVLLRSASSHVDISSSGSSFSCRRTSTRHCLPKIITRN